jgi:hypothetical protein
MPLIEMIQAAIDGSWAYVLFSLALLSVFGLLMMLLFFTALAIGAAWRWLQRHSWRSVIVAIERKALG